MNLLDSQKWKRGCDIWDVIWIWYRRFGLWKWKRGYIGCDMDLIWVFLDSGNEHEALNRMWYGFWYERFRHEAKFINSDSIEISLGANAKNALVLFYRVSGSTLARRYTCKFESNLSKYFWCVVKSMWYIRCKIW
jgi:hypothetical protein